MSLRLSTWNINSVRLRIEQVEKFVDEVQPDVLCLQEIKVETLKFPQKAFRKMGYTHMAVAGQKGYHGVAILSRVPLEQQTQINWCAKGDARHTQVTLPGGVELHNFYVPAGGDEPDPVSNDKFAHKLDFVDEMTRHFGSIKAGRNKPMIIVGDLNIAPLECDVWSHKQLLKVVSHTPVEVEKLTEVQNSLDFVDAVRHFIPPPEPVFSWWSYRSKDWRASNRGRRLDHIWVTPVLKDSLESISLQGHTRDWARPSDHIPITVELDI